MGIIKKTRLLLSGTKGLIESNINNAFELLEKRISKKRLVKFHKKNPIPLYSFAYNIAADAWLSVHPEPNQSNLKILALVVKILNNMMLFQNCAAIAEALAIARHAGLDEELFLQTVGKSSGDSFALRNHATKAMLPRDYPEGAFSVRYALKDLAYALDMAAAQKVVAKGGELVREHLEKAVAEGYGDRYHPVVREIIDP